MLRLYIFFFFKIHYTLSLIKRENLKHIFVKSFSVHKNVSYIFWNINRAWNNFSFVWMCNFF